MSLFKRAEGATITKPAEAEANQQTPYGGCTNGVPVKTAPHLLVTGPAGSGKTSRVLAPGALLWDGPRVVVSTRTDYLKWLVEKGVASRGPLYVMDLAGELDSSTKWLTGVDYQMVTSDPTALITGDDDALAMASLLLKVGSMGASDGGGGTSDNGAFWQTLAVQSMAALLLAGQKSGGGIEWALRAAGRPEGDGADDTSPSWQRAYTLIADSSTFASDLLAKIQVDAKMRDSLIATMQTGLAPWLLSNVTGRGQANPVPFAPSMLEGPGEPTLAIIAPADGVAAGAAVAVVESIVRHWRQPTQHGRTRVLVSIDEAVNSCPIPKLPVYVAEGHNSPVSFVIAVQSTRQMTLRWGENGARVLREVFPAVTVLKGAVEREMLENVASRGDHAGPREVSHDHQGKEPRSPKRVYPLATELLPLSVEKGRLLLHGKKGPLVDLPGVWDLEPARLAEER